MTNFWTEKEHLSNEPLPLPVEYIVKISKLSETNLSSLNSFIDVLLKYQSAQE